MEPNQTDLNLLEQLLLKILSPQNKERLEAENKYREILTKNADLCLLGLILVLENSNHRSAKELSMILLRQSMIKRNDENARIFDLTQVETQEKIKNKLISNLVAQKNRIVQKKVCDVIAVLGSYQLKKNKWPELIPNLLGMISNLESDLVANFFYLFQQIAVYTGVLLQDYTQEFLELFMKYIDSKIPLEIRVSNLKAYTAFIVLIAKQDRQKFQSILPEMLQTISDCITQSRFDFGEICIQEFIETAVLIPKFFLPQINDIVEGMLFIAGSTEIDEKIRQLAIEYLLIMTEKLPSEMNEIENFTERIILILMQMIIDVSDDDYWEETLRNKTNFDNTDTAKDGLERLSEMLGTSQFVSVIFQHVSLLFESENWKFHFGGLSAITAIGQGCSEAIKGNLEELIQKIVSFINSNHPRVRYIACKTLSQMCLDFPHILQDNYHELLLNSIVSLLDDSSFLTTQKCASVALVNFCSGVDSDIMGFYSEGILQKLVDVLQNNDMSLKEEIITAISAVASSTSVGLIKFYEKFITYLKDILYNATGIQYIQLRGKTMECISVIGIAVGFEIFEKDGIELMEFLLKNQDELQNDTNQLNFLLNTWTNLSRVLGDSFGPYLENVMPMILEIAKEEIVIIPLNDFDDEIDLGDCQIIVSAQEQYAIKSSMIEEKISVITILNNFASNLSISLLPYIETISQININFFRFYYNDSLRVAAFLCSLEVAKNVFQCFENGVSGVDEVFLKKIIDPIFDNLVKAISIENEPQIISVIIETIGILLESYKSGLDSSLVAKFLDQLPKLMEKRKKQRQKIQRKINQDSNPEDIEHNIQSRKQTEEEILLLISQAITPLFQYHCDIFLPIFRETIFPLFRSSLEEQGNGIIEMQVAICGFVDIVEYCSHDVFKEFWGFYNPYVFKYISSNDPNLRQTCVYCSGTFAKFGGSFFNSHSKKWVEELIRVIFLEDSQSETMRIATDNAVNALAKFCRFQAENIPLKECLETFFSCLPISHDQEEAKSVYSFLCDFIEEENSFILGENYLNAQKIIEIFVFVINSHLVEEETFQRIINIFVQFKKIFTQKEFLQMISFLDSQEIIEIILNF